CERPEDREFTTQRPDYYMRDHRAELVAAGLTVMRAFFVAGQPQQTKPAGSFEVWSRTVRDCLVWLGEADPWLSTESIRNDDPALQDHELALHAWYELFDDNNMTAKAVVENTNQYSEFMNGSRPTRLNSALWDALQVVTNNDLNSRSLGDWLRGIKDRHIGG